MLLLPFFFSLCETNVLAFASVTPFSNYTGRDPAGRCVVFYHIRKSAGGTITSLLKRAGASSQRLDGNTGLQGWGGQGEEEISKDGKRKVTSWEPSEHAELFTGHFKWGAHEMIGNALGRKCYTTMVIRNPLNHTISRYFWGTRKTKKRSPELFINYLQTSYLRIGQQLALPGATAAEMTENTLSMLRQVDVLGLTEDIPGFLSDFNRAFGLSAKTMQVNKKNLKVDSANGLTIQHASGARDTDAITVRTPQAMAVLRKVTAADQDIYAAVTQLIRSRRSRYFSPVE